MPALMDVRWETQVEAVDASTSAILMTAVTENSSFHRYDDVNSSYHMHCVEVT